MKRDMKKSYRKRKAIALAARLEQPRTTPLLDGLVFVLVALAAVGYVAAFSL